MTISIRKLLTTLFILSVFISIIACGSSGGGDSSNQTPAADLSGTWNVQETVNGDCQGNTYPHSETDIYTVTQTGNDLSITIASEDANVTGTISGNDVSWEGTIPSDSGTSSVDFAGTVSDDGNTVTGSASWTWTDGSYSCSGTTDITAAKATESSINAAGTWSGTWGSSVFSLSGTFTANITQQYSTLSGSIDVLEIGMSGATLKGTVEGNTITFGDIADTITFTGTVSSDSTASGTYEYPSLGDNGTWQGTKS